MPGPSSMVAQANRTVGGRRVYLRTVASGTTPDLPTMSGTTFPSISTAYTRLPILISKVAYQGNVKFQPVQDPLCLSPTGSVLVSAGVTGLSFTIDQATMDDVEIGTTAAEGTLGGQLSFLNPISDGAFPIREMLLVSNGKDGCWEVEYVPYAKLASWVPADKDTNKVGQVKLDFDVFSGDDATSLLGLGYCMALLQSTAPAA